MKYLEQPINREQSVVGFILVRIVISVCKLSYMFDLEAVKCRFTQSLHAQYIHFSDCPIGKWGEGCMGFCNCGVETEVCTADFGVCLVAGCPTGQIGPGCLNGKQMNQMNYVFNDVSITFPKIYLHMGSTLRKIISPSDP